MSKAGQADSSLKFAVRKKQREVGEGMEEKGRTIFLFCLKTLSCENNVLYFQQPSGSHLFCLGKPELIFYHRQLNTPQY